MACGGESELTLTLRGSGLACGGESELTLTLRGVGVQTLTLRGVMVQHVVENQSHVRCYSEDLRAENSHCKVIQINHEIL